MHCHVNTAGVQNPDAFIFRDVAVRVSMASTLEGLHCIYAVQWTYNSEDGRYYKHLQRHANEQWTLQPHALENMPQLGLAY